MYTGLFLIIAVSFGEAIWRVFFRSSFNFLGYVVYPISFFVFASGSITYIIRQRLWQQCTRGHWVRVLLYTFLLTALLMYGLIQGNILTDLAHEAMLLYALGIFLVLGTDDKVCHSIIRYSTVVFWVAFIMCLLTYDIRLISADLNSFAGDLDNQGRYTDSVAYMFFRPFTSLGLPLFIHGWLEKKSRWHYLQILSLVGFLMVNVIIFKFRGALVLSALVVVAAILMRTGIARKLKILLLAMAAIIIVLGWMSTKDGSLYTKRVARFNETEKAVKYRTPESERYFKVMGYEWLWGRGVGGTYQYSDTDWGRNRSGVHIGWITFTLIGGLPLLIIMLTFFGAWISLKRRRFKHDQYYTAAWFWIPIFFADWLVNPIVLNVTQIPVYGLTFLLMARFGKRPMTVEKLSSASGAEIPGGLQSSTEREGCIPAFASSLTK